MFLHPLICFDGGYLVELHRDRFAFGTANELRSGATAERQRCSACFRADSTMPQVNFA